MSTRFILFLPHFLVMLMAVANLGRVLWNIPVTVGTWIFPGWTGALLFIGLGLIAAWSFRALALFLQDYDANVDL